MGAFLLPGPTAIPHNILMAGAAPMVNHRGAGFKTMFKEMSEDIKKVFKTQNEVITLTSSGSGGLEAAVVNFVSPGEKVLVGSIGNFGERFKKICERFEIEVDFIDFGWGNCVDPQVIKEHLEKDTNHEIKAVMVQHNETSTGVLNDIKAISAARGSHPALLIVDSISGMAAGDLRMDEWNIDVVVAGSQKAFMAPPGLAFISANDRAWAVAEANKNHKFYFDLLSARKNLADGQTPYTPAVSTIFCVIEALKMINKEGIDNIIATHYFRRDMIRNACRALGLKLVADDSCASPAVTAIYAPEGIDPVKIRTTLRDKFGITIAGGQAKFKSTVFRIGHLGYVEDMELLSCIAALELTLQELGYPVELGTGVRVCQEAIKAKVSK